MTNHDRPFVYGIGAMVLLFIIGFIGNIDYLIFRVSPSSTEIAFLPIIVGIFVWLVSKRFVR